MDPQSAAPLVLKYEESAHLDKQRQLIEKRDALLKLIKDLQAKHKVFPAEDFPDGKRIFNVMNIILKKVVREPLDSIAVIDNAFAEMICHAFFGLKYDKKPPESETDKLSGIKLLYSLLVAAFVSNSMRHIYKDKKEFATNHEYFETRALNLFNKMYLENKKKLEYHILAFDYEEVFRGPNRGYYISDDGKIISNIKDRQKKDVERNKSSRELLCVAYRGQCMKFIAHPACQSYIKTRWEEGKVKKLFDPGWSPEELEKESSRFTAKLLTPYPPRKKYIEHLCAKVLYLISYGIVLINKPWRRELSPLGNIGENLFYNIFNYVMLILIIEIRNQVYKGPVFCCCFKNKQYLSAFWWSHLSLPSVRSIFGFAGVVVFLLTFVSPWRDYMIPLSEIIFTICFVFSAVTTLNLFSFTDYFGPILKLIQTMAKSILKYMLIVIVFWAIYAVCYLSLSEGGSIQGNFLWKMFQAGAFELLGELRDDDRVGKIDSCSEILSGNYTQLEKWRCTFQSTLIPPLTFVYMMMMTIMLINIFTAMLSHEYESTNKEAANYSKFCKYGMLARFEAKTFVAYPHHILNYFIWLVYDAIKTFCKWLCCDGLFQRGPLRYVDNVFISFAPSRQWGSSPIDAVVNKRAVEDLFKKVMDQRTSHDFLEEVLKYANKKKTERGSDAAGGIPEAEKILEEIINQFTKYLSSETKKAAELRNLPRRNRPKSI